VEQLVDRENDFEITQQLSKFSAPAARFSFTRLLGALRKGERQIAWSSPILYGHCQAFVLLSAGVFLLFSSRPENLTQIISSPETQASFKRLQSFDQSGLGFPLRGLESVSHARPAKGNMAMQVCDSIPLPPSDERPKIGARQGRYTLDTLFQKNVGYRKRPKISGGGFDENPSCLAVGSVSTNS